ncbi:MAG: hypothetical protein BGO77_02810 [Caedibacter sp. 37-49]|mgnify:CR=1 FL=1|nr:MAG: hypothetical protein BGO77_02810 [Caedibacter sp. 37-49]
MPQEVTRFPSEIYSVNLKTINHINFSRRELDILTSLLSEKETKEIAAFLSIAPRTVDNSLYNISKRINVKTRQEIIEFIKRSSELPYIQEYYMSLSLLVFFEKHLRQISKTVNTVSSTCLIIYEPKDRTISSFIQLLKKHLELLSIQSSIIALQEKQELLNYLKMQPKGYHVFLLSEAQLKQILKSEDIEKFIKDKSQHQGKLIFLIPNFREGISNNSSFQTESPINIIKSSDYYSCVLIILSHLLPGHDFCTFKNEMKEQCIRESTTLLNAGTFLNRSWLRLKIKLSKLIASFYLSKKISSFIAIGPGLCLLLVGLFSLNSQKEETMLIRSDLTVPTKNEFLERSRLIQEIHKNLKGNNSIHAIALIGCGGAGKTTLARSYANTYLHPVTWEINAETKNSLMASFEELALSLAKTENEKKL